MQGNDPCEAMALVLNDIAALHAIDGEIVSARTSFQKVLERENQCERFFASLNTS